jgi:hypothetical protein
MSPPIAIAPAARSTLAAAADTLIPGASGMPRPSEVGIVEFLARMVAPADATFAYYPFATEGDLEVLVGQLGEDLADVDADERQRRLAALEQADEGFGLFWKLRELVYFGYYSRPAVTLALRALLPAARDYHGAPQPAGYAEVIEDWPADRYRDNRGRYTPTEQVRPLDREALARVLAAQRAADRGRALDERPS